MTARLNVGEHVFDLDDGWCQSHRDYCTMAAPARPKRRAPIREVALCGSVVSLVVCASHGWAWPTIVSLAVLIVALLWVTEIPA